jgi:hypothetical protein
MTSPAISLLPGKSIMRLAFPDAQGRWYVVSAEAELVEGVYHKLQFPGFETRSGEGFGITATLHLIEGIFWHDGGLCGRIQKVVLQNGLITSSVVVVECEPVVLLSDDQGSTGIEPPPILPTALN